MAVTVGGVDVLGAGWQGWYPEDLPSDWRMDYFANEFSAALFSPRSWVGEVALSVEDVDELEWPEHLRVYVSWDQACLDSRALQRFVERVAEGELVVRAWLLSSGLAEPLAGLSEQRLLPGDPSSMDLATGVQAWQGGNEEPERVLLLAPSEEPGLRELRQRLEGLSLFGDEDVSVFVDVSPALLKDTRLMLEMMEPAG